MSEIEQQLTNIADTATIEPIIEDPNQHDAGFDFAPPGYVIPVSHRPITGPVTISHVADFYRRYPGEKLVLFTEVNVAQTTTGFCVRITIPDGIEIDDYWMVDNPLLPEITQSSAGNALVWTVSETYTAGSRLEFQVTATVSATYEDLTIESSATLYLGLVAQGSPIARNDLSVQVNAKGDYLRYLPALYERDELMGRFLMLFESFWSPIDGQLDNIWDYLDTSVAPPSLLPWLASWFGMTLDERWSEAQQRQLLRSLVQLYRKRGTRDGLIEYLEIFTQGKVEIVEHRANNFVVGHGGRLGAGVALGRGNLPHTLTVKVSLPAVETGDGRNAEALPADEVERHHQAQRRMIEKIIDAEKPAHTGYHLIIEQN